MFWTGVQGRRERRREVLGGHNPPYLCRVGGREGVDLWADEEAKEKTSRLTELSQRG